MRERKTLADFPRFSVATLRKRPPDERGYTHFELEGRFDRIIPRSNVTWFWLLFGERGWCCVQWKSQDDATLAAVLTGSEKDVPDVVGRTLYYLSPSWQAFHVWMVLDPEWGWQRVRFEASDAVAGDYEAQDVSMVDGREVGRWTWLKKAERPGHSMRYYPANDEASAFDSQSSIVSGGWDHEHCELCNAHIDPGDFGYRDSDDRWMCEACYEKYVIPRDLSFVGDL